MYSNKFAAKLMNIRRLCKENVRNLSIFMVLSTHYPTFRVVMAQSRVVTVTRARAVMKAETARQPPMH